MINLKNKKGSVTVLVTVTILFMITILSTIYSINTTRRSAQLKSQISLKETYENELNEIEKYDGIKLPNGYWTVTGTSVDTGLVIENINGTQFVWVRVPKNEYVYEKAGLNVTEFSDTDYDNIEYDLKKYTANYKNSNYTDTWYAEDNGTIITANTVGLTNAQKELNTGCGLTYNEYYTNYKKMLKSIYQNKGFWIGRYETGIKANGDNFRYYPVPQYSTEQPTTQTEVIERNAYPYTFVSCRQAQQLANKFSVEEYTGNLLFGLQWDLAVKNLGGAERTR